MLPGRTNNHMLKLMQDYKVSFVSWNKNPIETFRANFRIEWSDAPPPKSDSCILTKTTTFCMWKKINLPVLIPYKRTQMCRRPSAWNQWFARSFLYIFELIFSLCRAPHQLKRWRPSCSVKWANFAIWLKSVPFSIPRAVPQSTTVSRIHSLSKRSLRTP